MFRLVPILAVGGSANGLEDSCIARGALGMPAPCIEFSCGIGRPTENPLFVGPDCVCSGLSFLLLPEMKGRLRRFVKTGRTLSTIAGTSAATALGLNLFSSCATLGNRAVVPGRFSVSLVWADVRRLRRRKYAHRKTKATTATAPREAPTAAAMTFFLDVWPVGSPVLSGDCVDGRGVLEDVINGERVAAAAVMARGYQSWLILATTGR